MPHKTSSLLAPLALASGAGLVALVAWSLLSAVEQGRARAELDARSNARELAKAMRASLHAPAVLEQALAAERFAVRGGVLQIDDEVGWLREDPAVAADPVVAEKLRQAQVLEFVRGDAAAARQQYDDLLGPRGPGGDAALPVCTAAAWQARREGVSDRACELTVKLETALAGVSPRRAANPTVAQAIAATALLVRPPAQGHAPQGQSAFVTRLLPALPAQLALPTLARLEERAVDVTALRAAVTATGTRRELLATVQSVLAGLPAAPLAAATGGRLLLWFPKPGQDGDGALLPPTFLQRLRLETAGCGELVFTPPHADAEEVVADFAWVVPEPLPPPSLLARPAAVVAATVLLVLVFVASAFFGVRALRREALAMRARAEFLTGVTHELKTPVASIRLIAEVLGSDDVRPAKQQEYYALLSGEAARLSMLIENVLDLGQMERGERAYDPQPCDAAAVVRDAVALFRPLAQHGGIALELRDDGAPAPAVLDAGAIVQALLNVLDNARKYGARKYAGTGKRIDVATMRRGDTFTVAIRDHGPGVPAAERERIFDRFVRGSAHRHGSIPGVGLGLYLARAITERHGGTLVCGAPADGPGAVFTLVLPLEAPLEGQPGLEARS